MNSLERLHLSVLIKQADRVNPTTAANWGAGLGPLAAGAYTGARGGDTGDVLRSYGRTLAEGAGGTVAGGAAGLGLGHLADRAMQKSPKMLEGMARRGIPTGKTLGPVALLTALLGSTAGGLAGSAHGAYAAAENQNARHPIRTGLSKLKEKVTG